MKEKVELVRSTAVVELLSEFAAHLKASAQVFGELSPGEKAAAREKANRLTKETLLLLDSSNLAVFETFLVLASVLHVLNSQISTSLVHEAEKENNIELAGAN